ncbi:hypothetical protein ACX8XP_15780 [Calditrichota bacterium LG25]
MKKQMNGKSMWTTTQRINTLRANKAAKAVLTVLFFLQTLAIPVSATGGVLCVANDHIALEFKQAVHECHNEANYFSNFFNSEVEYHQDACLDFPLLQHEKNLILKQNQKTTVLTMSPFVSTYSSQRESKEERVTFRYSPTFKKMKLLQSIVLLI